MAVSRAKIAPAPSAGTRLGRPARALQILRREGVSSLWFRALAETVYRRLQLYELPLIASPPPLASEVPLELGFLNESQVDEYRRLRPDTPSEVVARRFEQGQRCFVGRHDGRLVSARWLATGDVYVDYLECWIRLAPGTVYIHDTLTDPEYRGRRVSASVATHIPPLLADEGYKTIVGLALRENRRIQRGIARAGLEPNGKVGWIGPRGLRRHFVRGGSGLLEVVRGSSAGDLGR